MAPEQSAGWSDDEADAHASLEAQHAPYGSWQTLLYPLCMAALFYFAFVRRTRDCGTSWTSYYLFWILAPMLISVLVAHPAILLIVPIGILLRRHLPDPWQAFKHAGRIRALEVDVRANAENVTARRNLAAIWLQKRRPLRALPLVEQALQRDPESKELHWLRGTALLASRRWEPAVDEFVYIVQNDSKFRYGEAYLRAADALIALGRWEEAEEALDHFGQVNKSSIEGWYKRWRVRRALGDLDGARAALREAKQVWRDSPPFHRRRQLGWYLRVWIR